MSVRQIAAASSRQKSEFSRPEVAQMPNCTFVAKANAAISGTPSSRSGREERAIAHTTGTVATPKAAPISFDETKPLTPIHAHSAISATHSGFE